MTPEAIEDQLTPIFRRVFQAPDLALNRSLTAAEVARWDSLSHVEMIAAVEDAFGVRFKLKDVTKMKNVGDLIDTLHRYLNPA
ncbi:MAG: acyl carrier protein [Bacteroidia bacterium]|nr:acyl carrier protein [Bacteroidia bacterium]